MIIWVRFDSTGVCVPSISCRDYRGISEQGRARGREVRCEFREVGFSVFEDICDVSDDDEGEDYGWV